MCLFKSICELSDQQPVMSINMDMNKKKNQKYVAKLFTGMLWKLCSRPSITHVREHAQNIAAWREGEHGSSMRQQTFWQLCADINSQILFPYHFQRPSINVSHLKTLADIVLLVVIIKFWSERLNVAEWFWGKGCWKVQLVIRNFYDIRHGSIY